MKRLRAIVHGRVQGVGYRAAVHRRIAPIDVTGYVKNQPDGTVLIVAEGDQSTLEDVIDIAKSGSNWCSVSDIEISYESFEGNFPDFSIAY